MEQTGTLDFSSLSSFFASLTVAKVLPTILVLVLGIISVKILTKLFSRALQRSKLDHSMHTVLGRLFRILLYTIVALIAASTLGIDMTSLVALLSVVSLALSLAVQGALSNVAGGVQILSSHPFKIGDFVELSGNSGTVEETGLVYTTIRTVDGKTVFLPNSDVAASTIINYTALGRRRVDLNFSASYSSKPELVMEALRRAAGSSRLLPDENVMIQISSYGESAINYDVRVWCAAEDYWDVYYQIIQQVYTEFSEAGIEMTYPHLNVHINS